MLALEREPANPEGWLELADALFAVADYAGSVEACFVAARCDPRLAEPYVKIARVLVHVGGARQAMSLLEEAIAGPAGPDSRLLEALGDAQAAIGAK